MGDASDGGGGRGGPGFGLVRALATMLGVHIQYAQREAASDVGRIVGAVVLLVVGLGFAGLALLFGHVAGAVYLQQALALPLWQALALVAAGDAVIALTLLMYARAQARKPILKETRTMLRRTATSLSDI